MSAVNIDQLAHRAAARRNNKLRREYPLLAQLLQEEGQLSTWLTTPEEQRARIERQHRQADEMLAHLDNLNEWFKRQALEIRSIVAQHVTPAQIAEWEEYAYHTYPSGDAVYLKEFWFAKLVEVCHSLPGLYALTRPIRAVTFGWLRTISAAPCARNPYRLVIIIV